MNSVTGLKVDFSSRCNFKCDFCLFHASHSTYSHLDEIGAQNFKRMICDISARDIVPKLRFSGRGEASLRPEFFDLVEFSKQRNVPVMLITNGFALIKDPSFCVNNIDELIVSIHGVGPAHDKIVGVEGAFRRTIKGIKEALSLDSRYNVAIHMVLTDDSIDSAEELIDLFDFLKVRVRMHHLWPHEFNHMLATPEKIKGKVTSILKRYPHVEWFPEVSPDALEGYYRFSSPSHVDTQDCVRYSCEVEVLSDGSVLTLCGGVLLGNIGVDSISDILVSGKWQSFLNETARGLAEDRLRDRCRTCMYRYSCSSDLNLVPRRAKER